MDVESNINGADDFMTKFKTVFFRTRTTVFMKPLPTRGHLVTDEGEVVDGACYNDTFQRV